MRVRERVRNRAWESEDKGGRGDGRVSEGGESKEKERNRAREEEGKGES